LPRVIEPRTDQSIDVVDQERRDHAADHWSALILSGLRGCCPRCGRGKLFAGFLALRPRCDNCGLDFSFADSADGPAFFVMFISGFIVAGSALAVEIMYAPPYWVHAALWGPLILITTLVPLRPMKGLLIALQYRHGAAEGRFTPADSP
jgi:uncharacterized protein (DUF983 family)